MKKTCLLFLILSIQSAFTASFQNLGFDAARVTSQIISDGGGPVDDLLPGWQHYFGTQQVSLIGYNSFPLDGPYATLISQDASSFYGFPVEGPYAVVFYGRGTASFALHQQGDIPAGVKYLTILEAPGPNVGVSVTINNILIPYLNFGDFWNPNAATEIFYDISAFAGQNVDLGLSVGIIAKFDSIAFVMGEPVFVESDFNGDGLPDVVFEHEDGFVGVWFMNKGPDLVLASFFNPESVGDPAWHIVGTGNFSHTNKTDLLFQHEDGSLAVWSMDGTNLVSSALLNPGQPGAGWKVVGTGDMNHDGKKDILFQHTDGTLGVWFMDGINLIQGAFINPNKPGESGWRVVGTAALSSVGNTDLILQHSDGTLAAWYMDGTNLVRGALLNPSTPGDAGWRVAATLDLNGDGKTDLFFQHDDGTIAVWLMDGIDLISGEFLNPENPGAGWRIVGPK